MHEMKQSGNGLLFLCRHGKNLEKNDKKMVTCNLILGILIQHSSKEERQRSLKTEQE